MGMAQEFARAVTAGFFADVPWLDLETPVDEVGHDVPGTRPKGIGISQWRTYDHGA